MTDSWRIASWEPFVICQMQDMHCRVSPGAYAYVQFRVIAQHCNDTLPGVITRPMERSCAVARKALVKGI